MADDSDSGGGNTFGDYLKAIVVLASAYALKAAQNALLNGSQKSDSQSIQYAVKQSTPPCLIHIGDHARAAPAWAFNQSHADRLGSVHLCIDGRRDSIYRRYLNDDWVTIDGDGWVTMVNGLGPDDFDGRYIDTKVKLLERSGLPTETAYTQIIDTWPELWTSAHRGDGTASICMLCYAPGAKFFPQAFPSGRPTLTVAQRGVCYDWRHDTTAGGTGAQRRNDEATWQWSANPVVWLVHLETQRWGIDWARQVAPVLADLTAQADICDEAVTLDAGGTEPRYRLAGVYKDDEDRDSVRKRIMAVMDGYRTLDGRGRLVIKAGAYEAPAVTLRTSDIKVSDWQSGVGTERRLGRLQVFFTSLAADFAKMQCDDLIIDEESPETEDFYPEWCPSFTQAKRLAKRYAAKAMPAGQGSISTNVGGLKCWGQRYVRIQNSLNPDMADIVVEIPDGLEMSGVDGFTFAARAIDASIDDWTPAIEEGADPGAKTRPTTVALAKPAISSVVLVFDSVSPDLPGLRLTVTTTGPDRNDATWFSRWRDSALGGGWVIDEGSTGAGATGTIVTNFAKANALLEVEAAYSIGSGQLSPWSDAVTIDTTVIFRRLEDGTFRRTEDGNYRILET